MKTKSYQFNLFRIIWTEMIWAKMEKILPYNPSMIFFFFLDPKLMTIDEYKKIN